MSHRPRSTTLALAGIVLVGALVLWTQARQVHLWAPDEEYFVQMARLLTDHFPSGIWDMPVQPFDERGIQRLTILLLAVPLTFVNGEAGIEIGRALMCLAFTSAAIPGFLLARGARLDARWSLITAALVVLVPWTVLTGSFLTESVAYPAALWAVWGAWRACVRPGWRSDVLALALVLVAGFARTNLLVLITVAPLAVTLHTLASVGWRRLPAQLWRDHPIYAVLIVPGAIVVVLNLVGIRPGPLGRLSGGYVTSLDVLDFGPVPKKMAGQFSRILTGLGVLPLLVGIPWMLRQAFRRTSPELGALAITGLVGFLVVIGSTVYAAPEERYLMLAAPYLLVPGVVAIARRELPAWTIAVAGVVAGILVWRIAWPFTTDPAHFLTDPSEAFVGRVLLSRLPGNGQLAFGLLVVVAGLALAWLLSRRARWAPLAAVGVLALVQLAQTGYVVTKHTALASGPGTLADWTWVDDRVGDAHVGIHAVGRGNSELGDFWRDVTFFNRHVDTMVSTEPIRIQIPRYGFVVPYTVAPDGTIVASEGTVPRWMLQPTGFRPRGLLGDVVERSTYLPVELVRLRGAPRVTWDFDGPDPDGWLSRARPKATVAVFPPALAAAKDPCLQIQLAGPPETVGRPVRYRAGDDAGSLATGQTVWLSRPLRDGDERLTIRASDLPAEGADGRALGVRITDVRVGECGATPR